MIFDVYSNILRKKDIMISQALEGHITGGIWTYSPPESDTDYAVNQIVTNLESVRELHLVKAKDDWDTDAFNVVLGLREVDPTIIHDMYEKGFRHGSVIQNDERSRRKLVNYMASLGMVVDVTGADEQVLREIISETDFPVVATAANCYELMPYKQNLTDSQIKAIASTGGFIGVTATSRSVHSSNPSVVTLVDHIDYLKQLVGTSHIALGFNFIENRSALLDCQHEGQAINVVDELYNRGYTTTEIEAIAATNAKRIINQILKA